MNNIDFKKEMKELETKEQELRQEIITSLVEKVLKDGIYEFDNKPLNGRMLGALIVVELPKERIVVLRIGNEYKDLRCFTTMELAVVASYIP